MKETIRTLKSKGIGKVGLWMALEGYWFGIDPKGELMEKYDCKEHDTIKPGQPRGGVKKELELLEPMQKQWLPSPERADQFWLDWFTELKSWGIDFVKVSTFPTTSRTVCLGAGRCMTQPSLLRTICTLIVPFT